MPNYYERYIQSTQFSNVPVKPVQDEYLYSMFVTCSFHADTTALFIWRYEDNVAHYVDHVVTTDSFPEALTQLSGALNRFSEGNWERYGTGVDKLLVSSESLEEVTYFTSGSDYVLIEGLEYFKSTIMYKDEEVYAALESIPPRACDEGRAKTAITKGRVTGEALTRSLLSSSPAVRVAIALAANYKI